MTIIERLDAGLEAVLSDEERMTLESVRALSMEIAARAEHYDRTSEFPWANVEAINALGLNAMVVPEA